MVTKAEKIFFAVMIAVLIGTAIFWREIRMYLAGSSQVAKTESTQKKKEKGPTTGEGEVVSASFSLSEALHTQRKLPSDLKEISGLAAVGDYLWAVSDKPKKPVMKLDKEGNIVQELTLTGIQLVDPEALTTDRRHLYIGDIGDNEGQREERKIYRLALSSVGNDKTAQVKADVISFSFEGQTNAEKKKKNEFDCEAMFYHNGSLYLFTKRRTDKDTELFQLPATPGKHTAKSLGVFETKGMITGAAINAAGTEVALTGYHKGHTFPFILLLKNFRGDAFFKGETERIELAEKEMDWQVESITFAGDNDIYFANEGTKDVPAMLFGISRNKLANFRIKQKGAGKK